uniref:beta/gamma crystallin domain-containing protein 3-like n=1 Tax=Oncorhynchus gorbuscha TaxID=8017 RepID=UPI001EAEB545|nr:beta/gamma crystallin domain-containing protein 3-like [Oncorhynchus gorbuscha]
MVPPATEELRSLSGGVGMEQLASSSSLSILSLLQSVSERLQSSGYSDTDADLEEPFIPPLRRPLWDFFNSGQAEGEEGDGQGMDGDQSSKQEGPGSLTLPTDPFTMGPREGYPMEDVNYLPTQKPADSPMNQYLKSAPPVLPEPDDDNGEHHAELIPRLSDNKCPSTATDMGENWSCGKVIPRPTLMNIFDGVTFSGERRTIHADQEDSGMVFPQGASVRVLGGCWLLYLEPGFQGPWVLLEEGETVLSHQLGQQQASQGIKNKPTSITIGSIRRLLKDDSTPEIHLLPIGAPGGATEHLYSKADILGTRGGPIHLSNLTVKSGCWLAYDNPGFHGNYAIMEAGGSPTPGAGHPQVAAVRSLRPLRMSGLRVRRPLDPKLLVFEQPHFQGRSGELGGHTPSLGAVAGLKGALSLRVIGGVWVGYTGEDYTGWQYLLEEGEYSDCADLGGADHPLLLSFRFLQADFIEPSVSLQEETGCPGDGGRNILDLDIPDLEKAGATEKTTAISVKSGVWVAYSERCFSGEQCILEKGKHPATLHWGGNYGAAKSIRPIRLELCGTGEPKVLLRAYSQPHYGGVSEEYEGEAGHCGSPSPMSFRVIRGNWLLFDEDGYYGNQYVLGEGLYPDLISCGCVDTSVKSLRPIPYSFSDPSISLFSLDYLEGPKMVAVTPTEQMKDFFTQSLRVDSGLWVVYEYSHYKGRQMLLQPGELPVWGEHSGWDTIASLRPLKQPRLYIEVRNRALGSVLTSEIVQDDLSLARVSLSPACSLDTQRWLFTGGLLCCKASKACLSVIGGKATVGARVALWAEHGRTHQRWSLNHNGTISSHLNHKLVLDFRGRTSFERDHLVVNEFAADQATQFWDMELV